MTLQTAHPGRWLVTMVTISCLSALAGAQGAGGGDTVGSQYSLAYQTPTDCLGGEADIYHEYYNTSHQVCTPCQQNSSVQTVSEDGLRCVCRENYRILSNLGSEGVLICAECPTNQVASLDGWNCVACVTSPPLVDDLCPSCQDPIDVEADRDLTGKWLNDSQHGAILDCVTCGNETLPDSNGQRCERCNQILSVQDFCDCPEQRMAGGLCFADTQDLAAGGALVFTISYSDDLQVESSFLEYNLLAAQAACTNYSLLDITRIDYSNLTACQLLGNMCVMTLYSNEDQPNDACALYRGLVETSMSPFPAHEPGYRALNNDIPEWKANMPWLYYLEGEAEDILGDPGIDWTVTVGDTLTFMAAKYSVDGHFQGYVDVEEDGLFLCQAPEGFINSAFTFGTKFSRSCQVSTDGLFDDASRAGHFYELFLRYNNQQGEPVLFALPILLTNYMDSNGNYVNRGDDRASWQLLRRYFLVDTVAGREAGDTQEPSVVRYLSDVTVYVTMQSGSRDGQILPPYVKMTYNYVSKDMYGQGQSVDVSSNIVYEMSLDKTSRDLSIAVGVMSGVALVIALLQTVNWNRRQGKLTFDLMTLIQTLLHVAGSLSNAFLAVSLGFALWWFILYKAQSVLFIVPDPGADFYVKAYVGSAFALKAIQLAHLLARQATVDLFFIDWEKPRKRPEREVTRSRAKRGADDGAQYQPIKTGDAASAWRTLFVGNEWIERQTSRKVQPVWQLVLVLIVLYVTGVDNLARTETASHVTYSDDTYQPPYNTVFRFALSGGIFVGVAILQWIFHAVLWTRCVEHPMTSFVDLCSLSNVSVFLLSHDQYGHYIHGRSVHGVTDVGLRDLHINLLREEENMCGSRGLVPGCEEQTFEMFIPKKLRDLYNRVIYKVWETRAALRSSEPAGSTSALSPAAAKQLEAYDVINRFLQNFLDHNLKDVDYVVSRKGFFARLLDTEKLDNFEKGYFFTDGGHSFDTLLFYGNEFTLSSYELLWFSVMDLAAQNFLLAAILTYVMIELVAAIRRSTAKKNVAKKTMIDQRFLI